jgi:hypothetical protein
LYCAGSSAVFHQAYRLKAGRALRAISAGQADVEKLQSLRSSRFRRWRAKVRNLAQRKIDIKAFWCAFIEHKVVAAPQGVRPRRTPGIVIEADAN